MSKLVQSGIADVESIPGLSCYFGMQKMYIISIKHRWKLYYVGDMPLA